MPDLLIPTKMKKNISKQTDFEGEIKDAKTRSFSSDIQTRHIICMISFVFGFRIINEFEKLICHIFFNYLTIICFNFLQIFHTFTVNTFGSFSITFCWKNETSTLYGKTRPKECFASLTTMVWRACGEDRKTGKT